MAVYVTVVPAHTAPDGDAAIVTAVSAEALTVIVIEFDVALSGEAHAALDVMTTDIWSPLPREEVV